MELKAHFQASGACYQVGVTVPAVMLNQCKFTLLIQVCSRCFVFVFFFFKEEDLSQQVYARWAIISAPATDTASTNSSAFASKWD